MSKIPDGSRRGYGSFGSYYSNEEIFFNVADERDAETSFTISMNNKKFYELQKIFNKGEIIMFEVRYEALYTTYNKDLGQYSEFYKAFGNILENARNNKIENIIISTDEFIDLTKRIKHFEIYRLEIPFYKTNIPSQESLKRAMDLMLSAKSKLIESNYHGALLDLRNVISTHLFEKKDDKNEIKATIRDCILLKVPSDLKSLYEDILDNLTIILNRLLKNLHRFVHEDGDRLQTSPMPQDVECIYFTLANIIRYLASYE